MWTRKGTWSRSRRRLEPGGEDGAEVRPGRKRKGQGQPDPHLEAGAVGHEDAQALEVRLSAGRSIGVAQRRSGSGAAGDRHHRSPLHGPMEQRREPSRQVAAAGAFQDQPVVYQILFAVGDHDTTASATGFLLAVSPVFTVLYIAWIRRQPHRLSQWLGVGLSLLGVGLLVIGQPASPFAPNPLLGDVLDVLAALTWASYTIISQPMVERHDPIEVMLWSTIFGFLVLSLALPVTGMPPLSGIPLASWLAVAFAVGPVTLFGLAMWQVGVRQLGPTAVSVYINAMPVVGAIAAHFALGEGFGWLEALGAVVVLSGLVLTRRPAAAARVAVGQPTVAVDQEP